MLRRRLIFMIGPLIGMLVVTAIVGIWILEGTLAQLDHVNDEVMVTFEQVNDLVTDIRDVRRNLHELEIGHKNQTAAINATMAQSANLLDAISQSSIIHHPAIEESLHQVQYKLPLFNGSIADLLAAGENPAPAAFDIPMAAANDIDQDASRLAQFVRQQAHLEHHELSARFRQQVLILAAIAILVVNFSILALLRLAAMILRPVDKLVEAAHQLGQGRFAHRVDLTTTDEFGQLAGAYNDMARQLQAAEQRRMEVLSQVALTMNHELKNMINIIELQLTLLSRRESASPTQQGHLQQIRTSLARMTRVVDDLRHTRRIVLTDYMTGVKMLDLNKSTQETDQADETAPAQNTAPARAALECGR